MWKWKCVAFTIKAIPVCSISLYSQIQQTKLFHSVFLQQSLKSLTMQIHWTSCRLKRQNRWWNVTWYRCFTVTWKKWFVQTVWFDLKKCYVRQVFKSGVMKDVSVLVWRCAEVLTFIGFDQRICTKIYYKQTGQQEGGVFFFTSQKANFTCLVLELTRRKNASSYICTLESI